MTHLLLTVRFLDDRYHGLLDRGGPVEWPPSPFRLFQALVAGVARRGELVDGDDICLCATCKAERKHRGTAKADEPTHAIFKPIGQSLGWLQKHSREHPPIIIAPKHKIGQAITRFVPNNDGDKKFVRQERLTAKPTIPTLFLLEPDQKPEVHYVWDISGKTDCPTNDIEKAARSLTTLGWGIDMAFADARLAGESELQQLKGVRWYPKPGSGSFEETLRVPTYDADMGECTLCDLRHCHNTAINRIEHGKPLKTVDKPKVFDRVLYTSTERPISRPHAVFKLLDDNEDPARYPHAKLIHIAGMVRHVAIKAMTDAGQDADFINRVIRGKRDPSSGEEHKQISYVPLPSIGHEHADGIIRNVMLVAPIGMERELADLARHIDGQPLKPEGEFEDCKSDSSATDAYHAELRMFIPPANKFIAERYLGTSKVWHTVTPVILDGHNKKSKTDKPEAIARETEKLICKTLQRAGIETPCEFTWQSIPFLKNCLSAHKYDRDGRHTGYHRPKHLKDLTAVHLTLCFGRRADPKDENSRWIAAEVPGPITLGAGRHCGFGLMAAVTGK